MEAILPHRWPRFAPPLRSISEGLSGLVLALALAFGLALQEPIRARGMLLLGEALEARADRTDLAAGGPIAGIIALGGDVRRTREALALAKRFPDAVLVLSGPGPQEAAVAQHNMPGDNPAIIDRRATTTFENAWYSRDLVQPQAGERWIVVTSAVHMPRALASFRAVGFKVEPWAVYDSTREEAGFARAAQHEIVGLIYYWLRGRARLTA